MEILVSGSGIVKNKVLLGNVAISFDRFYLFMGNCLPLVLSTKKYTPSWKISICSR